MLTVKQPVLSGLTPFYIKRFARKMDPDNFWIDKNENKHPYAWYLILHNISALDATLHENFQEIISIVSSILEGLRNLDHNSEELPALSASYIASRLEFAVDELQNIQGDCLELYHSLVLEVIQWQVIRFPELYTTRPEPIP